MTPEVYSMYYWTFDFNTNDFIEYDETQKKEIDIIQSKTFGRVFPEMWVYSYKNPRLCMSYEDLVLYGNNMFNIHSMFPAIGKFDYTNYCNTVFEYHQEQNELEYYEDENCEDNYFNEVQEPNYIHTEQHNYIQTEEPESFYYLPTGLLDDEIEPHYYLPSGLLDEEEESHYYLPSNILENTRTRRRRGPRRKKNQTQNINTQFVTYVPVFKQISYSSQQPNQEGYYNGCTSF